VQSFAAISMLLIGVVTFVVGVRLLLVARRTRQIPEFAFGVAFLGGSVGSALAQIGQRLLWNDAGGIATLMNSVCFALVILSTIALLVCTWRIFRPDRAWARGLCIAGSMLACAILPIRLASGELSTAVIDSPAMLGYFTLRIALFSWTTFEAIHYHALLRRRAALGLADPVVTQQILFWGIASASTLLISATIAGSTFVLGVHPIEYQPTTIAITLFALVTSATIWCAFFPPEALRRRIEASA
jgi:hypothetical protein